MDFNEVANKRRSSHKFVANRAIPINQLKEIVEVAMNAPNMANRRPWEYYIVTNREILTKIVMEHAPGKGWANASALIVVCARPDLQKPLPEEFMWLDCAATQDHILLAATDKGYGSCWVGLYPDDRKMKMVQEVLKCESLPFCAAVIGVADEIKQEHNRIDAERIHVIE